MYVEVDNTHGLADIVTDFEPLLRATARRYSSVSYDDAYQEGCLALVAAVQFYDCDSGIPFAAYAAAKVRGDVRTAMRRLWTYAGRIHRPNSRDEEQHTNEVWDEGLAAGEEVTSAADAGLGMVDISSLMDKAGLSQRERVSLVGLMYGYSSSEIAKKFGVSVETAKTWRKRALRKVRSALV